MARISGVELPQNQKLLYALRVIHGIGPLLSKKVTEAAGIEPEKLAQELTEEEISKLQKAVEKYSVEGDLRRLTAQNIRRLEEIGAYRGVRHKKGLPARGQRTRSNARTRRGKRQTVGAIKKEMKAQMARQPTQSTENTEKS